MTDGRYSLAIVGSGIAGLTSAYLLGHRYAVTLFEAGDCLGGHTATQVVNYAERDYKIDTGFIVFNDRTYPNFIKLLARLNVAMQPTEMGFSVVDAAAGYEYAGKNLNTFFAQRKNLFKLGHWRMLRDILRFNRQATADFVGGKLTAEETLDQYLLRNRYSVEFIQHYLIPMGAAIWSSSLSEVREFSVLFFVRFFHHHGLLSLENRPQWYVVRGGSNAYIAPMLAEFGGGLKLQARVEEVRRTSEGVTLRVGDGKGGSELHSFNQVIFACHSDQALTMLADATAEETAILGAIQWRNNQVVLHRDTSLLPRTRLAWSSWNYWLDKEANQLPMLTYYMNLLQGIESPVDFCVTLNDGGLINPDLVINRYQYAHPIFSAQAHAAQARWREINGVHNTWFTGAYWLNGFHEDGVVSALRVAELLGVTFE